MEAILTNSKRINEVLKIHSNLKKMFDGLSLEEILIVGYNWKPDKIKSVVFNLDNDREPFTYNEIKEFFYQWDYNSSNKLSKFKLYNQIEITKHARYRAVFLQDMKSKGYDLSMELSITQLEEIACHSISYTTVTYAIKCYLISNFSELDLIRYKGIQPQTGPVHNANELLFGGRMSNYEHTVRCNMFANEVGLSSTYINTAFYTMGK